MKTLGKLQDARPRRSQSPIGNTVQLRGDPPVATGVGCEIIRLVILTVAILGAAPLVFDAEARSRLGAAPSVSAARCRAQAADDYKKNVLFCEQNLSGSDRHISDQRQQCMDDFKVELDRTIASCPNAHAESHVGDQQPRCMCPRGPAVAPCREPIPDCIPPTEPTFPQRLYW